MDDLLSIATKTMEGFNPATDSVEEFEKIPDGDYKCLLENVKFKENDKGTKWISFDCSIIDGEYENKHIFVNWFFTEKSTEISIKRINKLAYELGYEISVEAYSSYDNLVETLNQMVGNQVIVHQKTSKNDFTNHTMTALV